MFRKLFKRYSKPPLPPMPTTRDSLERVARLLGCDSYTLLDDELIITTNPLGEDSDITGGIQVKVTLGPPTTTIEPRMASATYTYTTKSSGVQQEFTRWDVMDYPFSATIREQVAHTAWGVHEGIFNIVENNRIIGYDN